MPRQQIFWDRHAELTSTNDRALELLRSDCPRPFIVVAERQTAGRGRDGNTWHTGAGAIAATLGLDINRPWLPWLSLMTAMVIAETLEQRFGPWLTPRALMAIRWPNDVLFEDKKLAGILIESPNPTSAAVGFGINTNNTVAGIDQPAVSLQDIVGRSVDSEAILQDVVARFWERLDRFDTDEILTEVRRRCIQIGRETTVRGGISGLCTGIAADGALILETPTGIRHIR